MPSVAWRIDKQVLRGEIDNRIRGIVTGRIWLSGRAGPVELQLQLSGNPWRDLAGHVLRFTNPDPEEDAEICLRAAGLQKGLVGDITASRKVRIPDCSLEEIAEYRAAGRSYPWHWGNALYLEWFSERNGRVVIETTDYDLVLDALQAWEMTEEEELTTEEEAESTAWIEEINAAAEEALAEMEAEKWKGEGRPFQDREDPLVKRCGDLSVRIHKDLQGKDWLPEDPQREHPLIEIVNGSMSASAKLAGALNRSADEDWPPPAIFAGDTLVRLKKARDYLRGAILGLDSADEEDLATSAWRAEIRREIGEILEDVQGKIREVRQVLADEEE